jgi:hypothetical protein
MTECTQNSFDFEPHFSRRVTAEFDGGTLTTDGGGGKPSGASGS